MRTSTAANESPIFVDTGGWYAIAARRDRNHARAVRYYRDVVAARRRLLTSDFVLDETLTRLRYDMSHQQAVSFWEDVQQAIGANRLLTLRVDERIWDDAMFVFRKYADQVLSFTDCTTYVLARAADVSEVFGFDEHFRFLGFVLTPVP